MERILIAPEKEALQETECGQMESFLTLSMKVSVSTHCQ